VSTDEERFAGNLRSLRVLNGMTQAALAKEMTKRGYRWHQATVYKIESGERQVQLGEARAIAKILYVTLEDMLRNPDESLLERRFDDAMRSTFDELAEAKYVVGELGHHLVQAVLVLNESPELLDGIPFTDAPVRPTNAKEYLRRLAEIEKENSSPRVQTASIDQETVDLINAYIGTIAQDVVEKTDEEPPSLGRIGPRRRRSSDAEA
jgi:transcriptional regulator with XRE-family HTH domain